MGDEVCTFVTTHKIHQALYGYSDGHRLLASSQPIVGPTGHLLRAVSDMSFDGESTTYLTVLPIPDLKAQAFIRTWPAPDSLRPGSVWSHALLVSFVDLGELDRLDVLFGLFREPPDALDSNWLSTYMSPIELAPRDRRNSASNHLDVALSNEIIAELYSSDEPVSTVADIAASERILCAVHEQQWPRLRRSFSYRTRSRSSVANPSFRFDIEVVERARSVASRNAPTARWVNLLAADLNADDITFRRLLRRYGAESARGRKDMAGLASIIGDAYAGTDSTTTLDDVCRWFPETGTMRRLKRDLLGPPDESPPELKQWPRDDLFRLAVVLDSDRPCLDLEDLGVPQRLRLAWRQRPQELLPLVARLQLEETSDERLNLVISVAASEASAAQVAELALQSNELALRVVQANPTLLQSAELWAIDGLNPALIDLLGSLDRTARFDALLAAFRSSLDDAAARICAFDTTLWWDVFRALGQVDGNDRLRQLYDRGQRLRAILERIGPAAIGIPPTPPTGFNELVLLAHSANPNAGLWQHSPSEAWIAIAESLQESDTSKDDLIIFRIFVIALVSATRRGSADIRQRAWLATFAAIHRSLATSNSDVEAWALLATILPRDPEWDRCGRLRRAAMDTVVRDRWEPDEIQRLLDVVPEYGTDLAQALRSREQKRKKSRRWLLEFVDRLLR